MCYRMKTLGILQEENDILAEKPENMMCYHLQSAKSM